MGRFVEFVTTMGLFIGIIEANIKAENSTWENPLEAVLNVTNYKNQTLDLGCSTTVEVPFCWWAIEIGKSKWRLYTNGMSSLLEYNIRPFCINIDEFYGFSFTNKTIKLRYFDKIMSNTEMQSIERQILVDMFYFCCSRKANCFAFSGSVSENEIIHKLANKMLPYINMANGFNTRNERKFCIGDDGTEMVHLPGVDVCIFVADSSTQVKIYNGPMMFNHIDMISQISGDEQSSLAALALNGRLCLSAKPIDNNYGAHLKDGECLHDSTGSRYLLFCCCYSYPHLCSYAIDVYARYYSSGNSNKWIKSMKSRRVRDIRTEDGKLVAAHSWTYRDFLYSSPNGMEAETLAPTYDNVPLWHCALGTRHIMVDGGMTGANRPENVNRTELPERVPSCTVDLSIYFLNRGNGKIANTVAFAYDQSVEQCGKMTCYIATPKCVDELLNDERSKFELKLHCCCGTHNLCNRDEYNVNYLLRRIKAIGPIHECVSGMYEHLINAFMGDYSQKRILCLHFINLHDYLERYLIDGETFYAPVAKGKQFTEQYFEDTIDIRFKIVVLLVFNREGCEIPYSQQIMQFGILYCSMQVSSFKKEESCDANYRTYLQNFIEQTERPICYSGTYYVRAGIISGQMDIMNTTDTPLCVNEIHAIDDDGSAMIISDVFDPLVPWKWLRYVEPHISFGENQSFFHRIAYMCVSTPTKPCNGLYNLMYNLLPRIMTHFARWDVQTYGEVQTNVERLSRPLSLCETLVGEMKCATAMGCFLYRSFDGRKPLMGCIEDISTIHEAKPELRAVLDCRSMLWSNHMNICNAIVDATRSNGAAGVLCCCRYKCPAALGDSPTSNEIGFQNYNMIL